MTAQDRKARLAAELRANLARRKAQARAARAGEAQGGEPEAGGDAPAAGGRAGAEARPPVSVKEGGA